MARKADHDEVVRVSLRKRGELSLDFRLRGLVSEELRTVAKGVTEQRVESAGVPPGIAQLVDLRRSVAARLPRPASARHAVVVLRLQGRTSLGATFCRVIADDSRRLADSDGQLYLSGLSPQLLDQLHGTGALNLSSAVHPMPATDVLGESTREALRDAQAWLVEHAADTEPPA